ncbi:MAG: HDOD domain-containing protein, partial [Acidimicrobiales bacterium]
MGHNDSTTLQPASDIDTIVAEFGDLPTLAPVALEVIRLADDDRASLEDVGRAISRDPSLAGRMLRLANSAMYAPAREVSSLERATAILGLRT